jgi:hypothetical protein
MSDSYLTISDIAGNTAMHQRMQAAVTQQAHLGNLPGVEDPATWVGTNSYLWASSPTWAEKWDYAVETHPPEAPDGQIPEIYDPGRDAAVITDADILATVQALGGSDGG